MAEDPNLRDWCILVSEIYLILRILIPFLRDLINLFKNKSR